MTEGKFWMVWRHKGNIPVAQHESLKYAFREAERLSKALPGEIFYVLEAVGIKYTAKVV